MVIIRSCKNYSHHKYLLFDVIQVDTEIHKGTKVLCSRDEIFSKKRNFYNRHKKIFFVFFPHNLHYVHFEDLISLKWPFLRAELMDWQSEIISCL